MYNWLNNGRLNFSLSDLPHRNVYQRRKKETRGTFKVEQIIEKRPPKVNEQKEFGHWEVDAVLASRGQDRNMCGYLFKAPKSYLLGNQGTQSN